MPYPMALRNAGTTKESDTEKKWKAGDACSQRRNSNGAIPLTMRDAIAMEAGELSIVVVDATRQGTETITGPTENSLLSQTFRGARAGATINSATSGGAMTKNAITHGAMSNGGSWGHEGAWPDAAFWLSHGGERRQRSSLVPSGRGVPYTARPSLSSWAGQLHPTPQPRTTSQQRWMLAASTSLPHSAEPGGRRKRWTSTRRGPTARSMVAPATIHQPATGG